MIHPTILFIGAVLSVYAMGLYLVEGNKPLALIALVGLLSMTMSILVHV